MIGQRSLDLGRCINGPDRPWKHHEERIALRADFGPFVFPIASRKMRLCCCRSAMYASPSSWRSLVDPSISENRKVIVPLGRS
jgi:hypothetical protein